MAMDEINPMIFKLIHCGNVSLLDREDRQEKNVFFMPMGIFALAERLKANGVDVEIIHSDLEEEPLQAGNSSWANVTAVGFDCHWINQSLSVIETASALKRLFPHIYIFIGGFSASIFAREILAEFQCVDSVICGDAEKPLIALSRLLRNKDKWSEFHTVPNLMWRDQSQCIQDNGITYKAMDDDLEACDFAALELLRNKDHYRKRSIYWTHFAPDYFAPLNFAPLFFLEIGRGCLNDCLFCGGSAQAQYVINKRSKSSHRSVEAVMETIRKARSFGFLMFLSDFEFDGSETWYLELFQKIQDSEKDLWYAYSSWSMPSRHLVDRLTLCCEKSFLQLSPETADEAVRKMNKRNVYYSNAELEGLLYYCAEKESLKVQLYFGYFLAYETAVSIEKTIEYILFLVEAFPETVEICYSNYSTDPGSMLYTAPERYDVDMYTRTFQDYLQYIKRMYREEHSDDPDMLLFKPRTLTLDDMKYGEQKIRLLQYLFMHYRKTVSCILHGKEGRTVLCEVMRTESLLGEEIDGQLVKSVLGASGKGRSDDVRVIKNAEEEYSILVNKKKTIFKAKPQMWIYPENAL
jgi:radical SAM superfamily enzyme YgiQ (UPF0313 family)